MDTYAREVHPAIPTVVAAGASILLFSAPALAEITEVAGGHAAFLSLLPPSLQLLFGGLLYAEPAGRLVAHGIRTLVGPAAQPMHPVLERFNQATGAYERVLTPWRDLVGIPWALHLLLSAADRPLLASAAALAALGVSTFGLIDRVRVGDQLIQRQIEAQQTLTLPGRARQKSRTLGVLAPGLPQKFPVADIVTNAAADFAKGVRPRRSLWAGRRGLVHTFLAVGHAFWRLARKLGFRQAFGMYRQSLRSRANPPIVPSFLPEVRHVLLPDWAMGYARSIRASLRFEGMEKLDRIPAGAPVFIAGFPHVSIGPDFCLWAHPRFGDVRILADRQFHDHPVMRRSGLAVLLDTIGLPFVDRGGTGISRKEVLEAHFRDIVGKVQSGLELLYFINGGRVPRAFKENGGLDEPGFYSNVVVPSSPSQYAKSGVAADATGVATAMGRSAYVPLLRIRGASGAMQKVKRKPPFDQPITTGQTIVYEVVDVLEVTPGTTRISLFRQIVDLAKKATGIDEFLNQVVAQWESERPGSTGVAEEFARRAAEDERYYVLADRIRSIHPSITEEERSLRNLFKQSLFTLLGTPPDEGQLKEALQRVSAVVDLTQYDEFEEVA